MNTHGARQTLKTSDGTEFTYQEGLDGTVSVKTAMGSMLEISGPAVIELVAKGFVLPFRRRQLRKAGRDSAVGRASLEGCGARELLLGVESREV